MGIDATTAAGDSLIALAAATSAAGANAELADGGSEDDSFIAAAQSVCSVIAASEFSSPGDAADVAGLDRGRVRSYPLDAGPLTQKHAMSHFDCIKPL